MDGRGWLLPLQSQPQASSTSCYLSTTVSRASLSSVSRRAWVARSHLDSSHAGIDDPLGADLGDLGERPENFVTACDRRLESLLTFGGLGYALRPSQPWLRVLESRLGLAPHCDGGLDLDLVLTHASWLKLGSQPPMDLLMLVTAWLRAGMITDLDWGLAPT